jgi:Na+-driven multidrug efflux pump
MNGALLLYFRLLTDFGSVTVAAYTIGIRFLSFSWIPGAGFGSAAATLVGQSLGARRLESAIAAGWLSMWLAFGTALAMGAICIGAADRLAWAFTREAELATELSRFIIALGLMQPFVQSHFALGGAHRGAGDSWTPLIASTVGTCAVRAPLAAAAALGFGSDVRWLWGALVLDHAIRFLWLALSFRRGRWSRVRI